MPFKDWIKRLRSKADRHRRKHFREARRALCEQLDFQPTLARLEDRRVLSADVRPWRKPVSARGVRCQLRGFARLDRSLGFRGATDGLSNSTFSSRAVVLAGPREPPSVPTYDSTATFSVNEGDTTTTTSLVTVTRSGKVESASSVDVVLASGTPNGATPGSDFASGPNCCASPRMNQSRPCPFKSWATQQSNPMRRSACRSRISPATAKSAIRTRRRR